MTEYEAMMTIVNLRAKLEHFFFKGFSKEYPLPEDVNQTHISTLMFLHFNGSAPMSELSHLLNIEKGSFTPVANKLVAMGLIQKKRSEIDKRVYELSLTTEGFALADDFKEKHMVYMQERLKPLEKMRQEEFFRAIKSITDMIEELEKKSDDVILNDCLDC
ncbi:MarR family transcriptional regulator [Clostridia bacterium]|nr:MarR family transcriptional regulator [Clostridia bacterium]